jgi:diguanylate cyclase (GGDEF)-like protein
MERRAPKTQQDQLLAEVTMEARQALAVIQGYAEMLQEELIDDRPDVLDDLNRIRGAGDRLTALVASLEEQVAEARDLASIDPLTQIPNRRAFYEACDEALRAEGPVSLMLLDLDKFKQINDHYGHLVGDEVLKSIVDRAMGGIRQGDVLARLAGDEFVLLLPNATLDVAVEVASRLRKRVTTQPVNTSGGLIPVTLSVGVAERGPHITTVESLIQAADQAMYLAKGSGRNRVMTKGGDDGDADGVAGAQSPA